MLSYRHGFHAGNHADVLKHITLMLVSKYFTKKEAGFSYYDSHSGAALYDLKSEWASLTQENETGIGKLLSYAQLGKDDIPSAVREYLECFRSFEQNLNLFPGSPAIVHNFARKQDSLTLFELHNTEITCLEENVKKLSSFAHSCSKQSPSVTVRHQDGFKGLRTYSPPRPPLSTRGFALIDPSYETDDDYINVRKTLQDVHTHWRAGTLIVWYPLLVHRMYDIEQVKNTFADEKVETLCAELIVAKPSEIEKRLYGSGILVVQPTWTLKQELEEVLPFLSDKLGQNGCGSYNIFVSSN